MNNNPSYYAANSTQNDILNLSLKFVSAAVVKDKSFIFKDSSFADFVICVYNIMSGLCYFDKYCQIRSQGKILLYRNFSFLTIYFI